MENIPHHKAFTRSKPGAVSAFLCHFLAGRGIETQQFSTPGIPRPQGYVL